MTYTYSVTISVTLLGGELLLPNRLTTQKSLAFPAFYGSMRDGRGLTNRVRRSTMKRHLQKLVRGVRKQSGQSLVEYSLILALIAVVAILVLQGLGAKVNNTLSSVNANLP